MICQCGNKMIPTHLTGTESKFFSNRFHIQMICQKCEMIYTRCYEHDPDNDLVLIYDWENWSPDPMKEQEHGNTN